MAVEIITKQELETFKQELLKALQDLLKGHSTEHKKWLKTNEVQKILKLSPGTLQNLRINGTLPYTKIGGVYFYPQDEIMKLLQENLRNA
ncbi:MAG: helix-turn-helix domain-containing protein [Bacteroidota bacterium]